MFEKILIANRGEIACRVLKTARRMGIATVAVYSDADRDALHVALADEAVRIGPSPSAESYLSIDNIVAACRQTGAQAIHPGYGFLSENALFAQRLAEEDIVFIGPGIRAIESMGDKITSKRLAHEAGVNTVPGCADVIENPDHAVHVAHQVGYPIMLKASAGGGGKGMRIAYDDHQCRDAFERASSEARSSFGDDRVFIEKFIDQPRHIEIQILGDKHGHILYLGERECSLQRRHQKVIEESPSPFLDEETRAAMGQQAVALARAVEYTSAGTVEFIVDPARNFYFLEMNTRLQVEHPVTELVTGLDLVEWMIRIAACQHLDIAQADVKLRGWAIEARVYAEDPFRGFLPSVGRLVRYLPPAESDNVRVDTGVYEGGEVSIHYDPMIAKLITHGPTRRDAVAHLRHALNEFTIRGVSHNISFLGALVDHPRFAAGELSTSFIAEEFPLGFNAADVIHDEPGLLIATAATIHRRYRDRAARISGQLAGYEPKVEKDWVVLLGAHTANESKHPVTVVPAASDGVTAYSVTAYDVTYRDVHYRVETAWQFGQPLFRALINDIDVCMQVERRHLVYRLFHWGTQTDALVLSARAAELLSRMPAKAPAQSTKYLLSPMPGLLSKVVVAAGQDVKAGQDLAVIEAMKMENVLRADREAKVRKLLAGVGESLAVDQPILEFE